MNLLILVVDDEPDVEMLFRQQFRHALFTKPIDFGALRSEINTRVAA
jgi:hypothetical protein